MSSTGLRFKRHEFIKDLFNPKTVLQSFDIIEFSGFKAFNNVISKGLIDLGRLSHLKVNILDIDEWKMMKKVLMSTDICVMQHIDIIIPQAILFDVIGDFEGIADTKFNMILNFDKGFFTLHDLVESEPFKLWISANPFFIKIILNGSNYVKMIEMIGKFYTKGLMRFFDISFDYTSFQSLTLSDLHKLEFWINSLAVLYHSGSNDRFTMKLLTSFARGIKVTNDLKIYYPDSDILIFDLTKHLDKNGETVPSKELYLLRKYMDLKAKNVLFNLPVAKPPWNLVSWKDNFTINNELIEVPPITCMIMNWIYYVVTMGGSL